MKRLFIPLALTLALLTAREATAQVIDLRTGIVNGTSSTLIPYTNADDTWTVCPPGSNPSIPSSYGPVYCGSGIINMAGTYAGIDPTVRWLSPDINAAGEHLQSSTGGNYYYKTTFQNDCDITSAVMYFARIGADDVIDQIIVNGNIHTVSYAFSPLASGVTITIPSTEIVVGTNEIVMRVFNWGTATPTGIQLNGNLTLTGTPNANFCISASSTGLTATASGSGTHRWDVFSSPNGHPGTYNQVASFNTASISLQGFGPCYWVRHEIETTCGRECVAQSVCLGNCDEVPAAPSSQPSGNNGAEGVSHKGFLTEKNVSVQVYPNPAKGLVNLNVTTASDMEYTISIFDINGRLVKTFAPEKTLNKRSNVQWNTESVSKGTYLIQIQTSDNKVTTQKLVIE